MKCKLKPLLCAVMVKHPEQPPRTLTEMLSVEQCVTNQRSVQDANPEADSRTDLDFIYTQETRFDYIPMKIPVGSRMGPLISSCETEETAVTE